MQTAKRLSRRRFIGVGAMGVAAASYLARGGAELAANPLGFPIGCQTWPVRQILERTSKGRSAALPARVTKRLKCARRPVTRRWASGLWPR